MSSAARLRRRTNTTSRTPEHSGCLPARTCCQAATLPDSQRKARQKRKVTLDSVPLERDHGKNLFEIATFISVEWPKGSLR